MATRNLSVRFGTEGFNEAIASLRRVADSFDTALRHAREQVEESARAMRDATDPAEFERAQRSRQNAARQANSVIQQSFRELRLRSKQDIEREKREATAAYNAIKQSGVASAEDIGRAKIALRNQLASLNSEMRRTQGEAATLGERFSVLKISLGNIISASVIGAVQSLSNTFQQLGSSVLQTGAAAERQAVSFEVFLGSAEKAKQVMEEVRKFAATTPFELPEVTEAAKQLLAVQVPADELIATISMLGEIAAGADKPLSQLLFVYTQIKNQGKATSEEINQLTNAGIAMADFAKALGIAETEVKQLASEGKIGFEEVQKVLVSMTNEGGRFYGLMDKLGDTTAVKLSNLNDAFTKMYQAIYDGISPAISAVLDTIVSIIDPLSENVSLWDSINAVALEFQQYISDNPQIIQAAVEQLEKGMLVLLDACADAAGGLLNYLQQNPDAIAQAVEGLGEFVRLMQVIVNLVNDAIEGFKMMANWAQQAWQWATTAPVGADVGDRNATAVDFKTGTRISGPIAYSGGAKGDPNAGRSTGPHVDIRGKRPGGQEMGPGELKYFAQQVFMVGGKPLSSYPITSGFKPSDRPNHGALDYGVPVGEPITVNVPVKRVRHYFDKGGGGLVAEVTFADGSIVSLLHNSKKGQFQALGTTEDTYGPTIPPGGEIGSVYGPSPQTPLTKGGSRGDVSTTTPSPQTPLTKGGSRGDEQTRFFNALIKTAQNLGIDPVDLLALMLHETAGTLSPSVQNEIGATGLIQFLPSTAKGLGTSTSALAKMSRTDQLAYVEKYLKPHASGIGGSLRELASTVYTGAPGRSLSTGSNPNLGQYIELVKGQRSKAASLLGGVDPPNPPWQGGRRGDSQFNFDEQRERQLREAVARQIDSEYKAKLEELSQTEERTLAQFDLETARRENEGITDLSRDTIRKALASEFDLQKALLETQYQRKALEAENNTEAIGYLNKKEQHLKEVYAINQQTSQLEAETALNEKTQANADSWADLNEQISDFKSSFTEPSLEQEVRAQLTEIDNQAADYTQTLQEQIKQIEDVIAAKEALNFTTETEQALYEQLKGAIEEVESARKQGNKFILDTAFKDKTEEIKASVEGLSETIEGLKQSLKPDTAANRLEGNLNAIASEYKNYKQQLDETNKTLNEIIEAKSKLGLAITEELQQGTKLAELYTVLTNLQDQAQNKTIKQGNYDILAEQYQIKAAKQSYLAQLGDFQAEQLESEGAFFNANKLRKEIAIQQQNLAFEQELLDLEQQYGDQPELLQDLIDKARQLNEIKLDNINQQFKSVGETIKEIVTNAFTRFFEDVVSGTKSLGDAFRDMALNIIKSIGQIAAQMAALQIIKGISGIFGGGGGGGGTSFIGDAIVSAIPAAAGGGLITGPGSGTSDSILARLSNGEFVFNSAATRNIGADVLSSINRAGSLPSLGLPFGFDERNYRGGNNSPIINQSFNINAKDANSFGKSQSQIMAEAAAMLRNSL